jgi:hypothetical protein
MEILAWLACAVLINAACMAQIMKWQAHRIRGWDLRRGEALGLQARATLASALCALLSVLALNLLPALTADVDLGLFLFAFFVPYYYWLRHIAYRLAKSQRDRGRGVARKNVQQIASATFVTVFGIYAAIGSLVYLIWYLANAG